MQWFDICSKLQYMEQFRKHQRVEEKEYTSLKYTLWGIYAKQKHAEEKKSEAQLLVCLL